jgi:NAD(P)-dependent dehydrogenase (short-subunit alcohol dehydrogenase family)
MPSMRLDDRVAGVSGAGGGLGRGFAEGLSEAGADVVLLGRSPDPLQEDGRAVAARGP